MQMMYATAMNGMTCDPGGCYDMTQYFPVTWPHLPSLLESMPEMQTTDQMAGPGNGAIHPPGAGKRTQRQRKQPQTKANPNQSRKQGFSEGANESSMHANLPEDSEENEAAQDHIIQEKADGLLRELRSTNKPQQMLALADFVRMIFQDKLSSRAAQRALESASAFDQNLLASGLRGQVRAAMQSKHANYVITKAVEVMPGDSIGFISQELLGHGAEVARHQFGCRVICRILEHLSPKDSSSMELLDEVLKDAETLRSHPFGSIVMRHFLEHGLDEHRSHVAAALRKDLLDCALQRKGSHVVEAAFLHCSSEDCEVLIQELVAGDRQMLALATGQFGKHVALTLLGMEGAKAKTKQTVVDALLPFEQELRTHKYAKSVYSILFSNASPDNLSQPSATDDVADLACRPPSPRGWT